MGQQLLDATFVSKYTRDRRGGKVPQGLCVHKAIRIQNLRNWQEFIARENEIRTEIQQLKEDEIWAGQRPPRTRGQLATLGAGCPPDASANSAWLFHGTNEVAAIAITHGDFLVDKAGSNAGTMFGNGVYLAECCSKSDEYTKESTQGLRVLLVCRAVLGKVFYCDEASPDPDALVAHCSGEGWHSVLGDREKVSGTYREFMVYDGDQVYPEFVVWYSRVEA